MKRLLIVLLALFFSISTGSLNAQTMSSGDMEQVAGFAQSVAVTEGSILIGEPDNHHQPGMVYLFEEGDTAGWTQREALSASDGVIGNRFGTALSADADRVLIGAPGMGDGRGGAYLFEKSEEGSWKEVSRLALSDTNDVKNLGGSVALDNDVAFVGASEADNGNGAVYLFKRDASGNWNRQLRLANPDSSQGVGFGSALALQNNRLFVSAPQKGGTVYLFQANEQGEWNYETALSSNRAANNARFGASLQPHGDKIFVGAPRNASRSGGVFVFEYDSQNSSWTPAGNLVAFDSGPRYEFGSALAVANGRLWVGAPGANNRKGALYQFEQNSAGEWSGVTKVDGPERKSGDRFAGTLAAGDKIAVAGLTGADFNAGTAAILELGDQNWSIASTVLSERSSVLDPITGNKVDCRNGKASRFGCSQINLISFLPIDEIGGDRGVRMNDIWGWTDPQTGKEYALAGRMDGLSIIDVSNPAHPVYVANLPMTEGARTSIWRDIKVYENHAFVVADNAGEHGIQVLDLTKVRAFEGTPLTLEEDAHYDKVNSVHNIVINQDSGFAYAVGSSGGGQTCGGGLHMVNIQDPKNPTFAGCFADPSTGRSGTGYSHDAQCVIYHGPDEEHQGEEICIGFNETAISIANVTDKDNPKALSTVSYPDYGYVHQGWLTEDHRYLFQNDETDELGGQIDRTRTLIYDLTDLDDPQFLDQYLLDNASSDHNLYIKGDTMYQSNYKSGLQVIDVSDPASPEKVGFFDTEPFGEDTPGFAGTWSNYPFFESGIIIMTSSREGLFILEKADQQITPGSK